VLSRVATTGFEIEEHEFLRNLLHGRVCHDQLRYSTP
jgi:hypothetical protein